MKAPGTRRLRYCGIILGSYRIPKGNSIFMSVEKIKTMVQSISEMLVDEPEKIVINEEMRNDTHIIVLSVAKVDVGKVIGRSGQTAKALRALVNAAATRMGDKVLLEIRE
jgi:predicted RNA-binding protein YlqC (UPF0109 family)